MKILVNRYCSKAFLSLINFLVFIRKARLKENIIANAMYKDFIPRGLFSTGRDEASLYDFARCSAPFTYPNKLVFNTNDEAYTTTTNKIE